MVADSPKVAEPILIFDRHTVKGGNQAIAQLLIHWKNNFTTDATWEFASELKRRFPSFTLRTRVLGREKPVMKKW